MQACGHVSLLIQESRYAAIEALALRFQHSDLNALAKIAGDASGEIDQQMGKALAATWGSRYVVVTDLLAQRSDVRVDAVDQRVPPEQTRDHTLD